MFTSLTRRRTPSDLPSPRGVGGSPSPATSPAASPRGDTRDNATTNGSPLPQSLSPLSSPSPSRSPSKQQGSLFSTSPIKDFFKKMKKSSSISPGKKTPLSAASISSPNSSSSSVPPSGVTVFDAFDKEKMVIVGCGDSGKATIFKQLKYGIAGQEMTPNVVTNTKSTIYSNILMSVSEVGERMIERNVLFEKEETIHLLQQIIRLTKGTSFLIVNAITVYNSDIHDIICKIWNDSRFREYLLESYYDLHLPESVKTFFFSLERLHPDTFTPDMDDTMNARAKTTGLSSFTFEHRGTQVEIVLAAGQSSERRKWRVHYPTVTALIFVAPVSEYDQLCYEDDCKHRFEDTISTFERVISDEHLKTQNIYLVLNKWNIFESKFSPETFSKHFPEFGMLGYKTFEQASLFLIEKYKQAFARQRTDLDNRLHIFQVNALEMYSVKIAFETIFSMAREGENL